MKDELAPELRPDLIREGDAWVQRLTSGQATHADARALRQWRSKSPRHEAAFREAMRLRALVRAAGEPWRTETPVPQAANDRLKSPHRRRILTGAVAASAAGVAVLAGSRMFDTPAQAAEFVTEKGEQKSVVLSEGLSAQLNTGTRLARRPELGANVLELLQGEVMLTASLDTSSPLVALTRAGQVTTHRARFLLRSMDAGAIVTCLDGDVTVKANGESRLVPAGYRLDFSRTGLAGMVAEDVERAASWQRGALVFRKTALEDVVAEINRYRRGQIVIANPQLASRRVDGTFYLTRLDDIPSQLQSAFNVRVTYLPGGMIIVS